MAEMGLDAQRVLLEISLISEFEDEEEEEAAAVRGGERKFTNEMAGGWGRERGVVEIIIPIDVAPIIIAIIALSPLLFFLFSLHNKAAKKFPTMNSNLSAQTSLEKSSLFVSCPPRPSKRSKAPKNPPRPPFLGVHARCWESELALPVRDSPLSTHVRGGTVTP